IGCQGGDRQRPRATADVDPGIRRHVRALLAVDRRPRPAALHGPVARRAPTARPPGSRNRRRPRRFPEAMMSARITLSLVLVVGIGVGGAAAVVERRQPTRTISLATSAANVEPTPRVPLTPHGPVQVVARVNDPAGGAPWAL